MSVISESYIDRITNEKKSRNYQCHAGDPVVPTYGYEIINGVKMLVENGKTNIQERIESFRESSEINNIIARFLNGDTSVINPKDGTYGDFSNIPDNYAEVFRRVQACESYFDSLPVELKEKFDNSYQKFFTEYGTDDFMKIIDEFNHIDSSVQKEEIKESEVKVDAE